MCDRLNLEKWLDDNDIRTVRIETISLDNVVSGKYLSVAKFVSSVDKGFSFCDVIYGLDLANFPQLGFDYGRWRGELADILLRPELSTLVVDPVSPGLAAVICDVTDRDGKPLPTCTRSVLRRQVERLQDAGYTAQAAIEIEATVFENSIDDIRANGFGDLRPLGGAAGALYVLGRPLELSRYMNAVTERLDHMGIPWEGWVDESSPGQVELNLPPMDVISSVDAYNRARFVMREVALEQGRTVTFMARWSGEYFGQGSHINLSLSRDGENTFFNPEAPEKPSVEMEWFAAGVLATMPAASSFCYPTVNSYRRIEDLNGPPTTVSWGVENKTTAIRAICRDAKQSRLEYRIPSADSNMYLTFAALLAGGQHGLENRQEPPAPLEYMAWAQPDGPQLLPLSLFESIEALRADATITEMLGADFVEYWLGTRRWEWLRFYTTGTPWQPTGTSADRNHRAAAVCRITAFAGGTLSGLRIRHVLLVVLKGRLRRWRNSRHPAVRVSRYRCDLTAGRTRHHWRAGRRPPRMGG
jgi:glutamine synthetase